MNKATKILRLDSRPGVEQWLYHLTPPLEGSEYVVASATMVCGRPETYLFAADADGKITGWGELEGSYRGGLDHDTAIVNAGYEVQS